MPLAKPFITRPRTQSTTISFSLAIFFSLIHQWVLCIWFLTGNSIRLLSSNAPNGHYIENARPKKSIKWRQVLPGWWWMSRLMQVIWSHMHQSVASVGKSRDHMTPGPEICWNFSHVWSISRRFILAWQHHSTNPEIRTWINCQKSSQALIFCCLWTAGEGWLLESMQEVQGDIFSISSKTWHLFNEGSRVA